MDESDHNCISWICILIRGLEQSSKTELRDWKRTNWESMIKDYIDIDLNVLFENRTVGEMW